MNRILLALLFGLAGIVAGMQLEGTLAGLQDVEHAGGHFKAEIEQQGVHDPGHAYEDVDDDGRFANGTDVPIEDRELLDGRYRVQEPEHGLVVPQSVGTIEAPAGIELAAGDRGHLTVEIKLETEGRIDLKAGHAGKLDGLVAEAGGSIAIDAGRLRLTDAILEAGGAIDLAASAGPLHATGATLETEEAVHLDSGGAIRIDDARVETPGPIELTAGAEVYVKRATLETEDEILLEAGSVEDAIYVEGARFLDANDTAKAAPDGVEIVGEPEEGSISYEG